ncbi:D-alanyl-lipoteichoic acid biosynthesis protein DltD [Effusibacillus consociatus]|uniref:D-alanyl-lipoteichoic acid biosynthesis protein DltD n=1 Tax=Effusibacillus consociatus TaxID=1117041 RepID=A0ABV9Q5T7_9BACL
MRHILFFVFLAFFLVLGHVMTPWAIAKGYGFGENYRFTQGPNTTFHEVELFVDAAKRTEAHKIAFVGDSVVNSVFAKPGETLPVYLEQSLSANQPRVEVYNFGMQGALHFDYFQMIRYLHEQQAVDEFVINLSYPFFSNKLASGRSLYYRMLYPVIRPGELERIGIDYKPKQEEKVEVGNTKLESWVVDHLISKYNPYRYRDDLNHILFDGHPVSKSKEWIDQKVLKKPAIQPENPTEPPSEKDLEVNKYKSWTEFGWSEKDITHLANVYSVADLRKDPTNAKPFFELLEYAKQNNIRLTVVVTPINFTLLHKYKIFDENRYHQNMQYLKEQIARYGFTTLDFQGQIPNEYFHDSLHLLGPGNQLFAEKIANEMVRQRGGKL